MIGKILRIRYEIIEILPEESLFHVYLARDKIEGREVSIRVVKPPMNQEPAFLESLRDQIQKLSQVHHASVERLVELDSEDNEQFIVGEYTKGTPLSERIRRLAPFSVQVALSTAISVCEGLSTLHRAGIVHGDVGSHTINVNAEGEARLKCAGLWKSYSSSATAGYQVLPNMAPYLAPEISQDGLPNPASDVYSLGILLFELLTGRKPFHADQPVALAMKHTSEPVPSVKAINPGVPSALNEILVRCLSKSPADRYKNATELLSELRFVQDALRFGKSTAPKEETQATVQDGVAPKMSAIKEEPKRSVRVTKDDEAYDGDLPRWLKVTMLFLGTVVVMVIAGFIFFNMSRPKIVRVPDIRRLTISEAESKLRAMNLKMRIVRKQTSEEFTKDAVMLMDPTAGAESYEGSTIAVVVSEGSRFVEVPDLRGVTLDKAKMQLEALGLVADDRIEEVRSRTLEAGMIVSHVPERRQRVERGTKIRFRVAAAKENREPEGLDPKTKYLYTIKIQLTGLTSSVELRVEMIDARGTRTIFEESRDPDEVVEIAAEGFGNEAIFKIYYDGELVKQVSKKADEQAPDNDDGDRGNQGGDPDEAGQGGDGDAR